MCLAQGNFGGRLLGADNFKKLDPLMSSVERWDAKHVAPVWKGSKPTTSTAMMQETKAPDAGVPAPGQKPKTGVPTLLGG